MIFVAVDIGGTFTDLIGFDDEAGTFVQAKSLTTPADLVQGIIDCIRESGVAGRRDRRADPRLDHRDQHADRAQGRQDRPGRHARHARRLHHRPRQPAGGLQSVLPPPPAAGVAPAHRARSTSGVLRLRRGRRAAEDARASPTPARRSRPTGVEAVAVCFLHSYANPEHERVAGEMIAQGDAGRLSVAVARNPARVSRVRAHVDDGGERLYRPEGRRLCEEPEVEPRRHRLRAAISRSCARTAA